MGSTSRDGCGGSLGDVACYAPHLCWCQLKIGFTLFLNWGSAFPFIKTTRTITTNNNKNIRVGPANLSLELRTVKSTDAGEYQCLVSSEGGSSAASVSLTVQGTVPVVPSELYSVFLSLSFDLFSPKLAESDSI